MKNYKEFLLHIIEECNFIDCECSNLTYSDFENSQLIKRAVVRSLEIIGEAVKNLPPEILEQYPTVEWKNIARTRDKLIHHYFGVDYEIVWDIIKFHIPDLQEAVEKMRSKQFAHDW